ncbi:MAG: alpha/beta fold hydrolase [Candidatus Binataceae bacterium]
MDKSADGDDDPPSPIEGVDVSEFFFAGDGVSALLIHGMTGTPYEMRYVGERLAAAGVRVCGVRLAGHAGAPEELAAAGYDNWYESVVEGFERLRAFGEPNVVIGLSAGAVLGIRLALDQRQDVAGIVLLSCGFFLPRVSTIALTALKMLGPMAQRIFLHKSSGSDIHDAAARMIHPSSRLMPLSAPINLLQLVAMVRPRIGKLTQPVLIVHSRRDHTCPYERNVGYLMTHLGSVQKQVVELTESYHVITVDTDKERVAAEVVRFVEQIRVRNPQRAAAGG